MYVKEMYHVSSHIRYIAIFYQQDGDVWVFTVRTFDGPLPFRTVQVNYGGFAEGNRKMEFGWFRHITCLD
jgi:hypothetical protein